MNTEDQLYSFTKDEVQSIVSGFGHSFYDKLLPYLTYYAEEWSLTSYKFIPSYSANIVFLCHSQQFGEAVLKIARASGIEYKTELEALRQFNHKAVCRLLAYDTDRAVMLLQQVQPGQSLREIASLEQRLAIFCSVYRNLHTSLEPEHKFSAYLDWVDRITKYMSRQEQAQELYAHMKGAQRLCAEVSAAYPRRMLLHGDLHHDNILLGSDGQYVVIDPKGVIGDAVFDIPRFILNEFDDNLNSALRDTIISIINYLERELNIPQSIIRKLLYIETTMGACWYVEDGADKVQYEQQLARVLFAYSLLN